MCSNLEKNKEKKKKKEKKSSFSMSVTEASNSITASLDACSAEEIIDLLRRCNDEQMFPGLEDASFCAKLDAVADTIRDDPTTVLILSGCGTSGRIAMFCALAYGSEGRDYSNNVRYCISGGDVAFRLPVENAEDNATQGVADLLRVAADAERVVFVGITCGLSAPYVAGQLDHALRNRSRFVEVVLLGFNPVESARNVAIENWPGEQSFLSVARRVLAEGVVLNPLVGPEPVTGSTRMKGGSATKIVIDCIWNRANSGYPTDSFRLLRDASNTAYTDNKKQLLAENINAGSKALFANHSILYVSSNLLLGALAVIDASECPPTFGADPENVRAYLLPPLFGMTGVSAEHDFKPRSKDVVVVISDHMYDKATEDYVAQAKAMGASVFLIGPYFPDNQGHLELKLTLNAISTGAFVLFGKVYGNRMLDLRLSNNKLYFRAISIVKEIARVDDVTAKLSVWKSVYRSDAPEQEHHITDETAISRHVEAASLQNRVVPIAILLASKKESSVDAAVQRISKTPKLREIFLK
jgi:N-acetylmuramic acid 6-phosphate (MurNAc-6-P) etherase